MPEYLSISGAVAASESDRLLARCVHATAQRTGGEAINDKPQPPPLMRNCCLSQPATQRIGAKLGANSDGSSVSTVSAQTNVREPRPIGAPDPTDAFPAVTAAAEGGPGSD